MASSVQATDNLQSLELISWNCGMPTWPPDDRCVLELSMLLLYRDEKKFASFQHFL